MFRFVLSLTIVIGCCFSLQASNCPSINQFDIVEVGSMTPTGAIEAGKNYEAIFDISYFCTNERPIGAPDNQPFYIKAYNSSFAGSYSCGSDDGIVVATLIYNDHCTNDNGDEEFKIPLNIALLSSNGSYEFIAIYCIDLDPRCQASGSNSYIQESALAMTVSGINSVPTLGQWSLICLFQLMLIIGVCGIRQDLEITRTT